MIGDVAGEFEFHDTPALAQIAANRGIHESAIEWDGADFKVAEFRIRP